MGSGASKDDPRVKYSVSTGGVYKTPSEWPAKTVKKLIYERKLAPFFPAIDEDDPPKDAGHIEECPLCFLSFCGGMNETRCCSKRICTECWLQVQQPPGLTPQKECPFCMKEGFRVAFRQLTEADLHREKVEQEKVLKLEQSKRMSETMRALSAKSAPPSAADVFQENGAGDKGKTDEQEEQVTPPAPPLDVAEMEEEEMIRRALEMSLRDQEEMQAQEEAEREPEAPADNDNNNDDDNDDGNAGAGQEDDPNALDADQLAYLARQLDAVDDPDLRLAIQLSLGNDW